MSPEAGVPAPVIGIDGGTMVKGLRVSSFGSSGSLLGLQVSRSAAGLSVLPSSRSATLDRGVVESLRAAIVTSDSSAATAQFVEQTEGLDAETITAVMLAVEQSAIAHHLGSGIPLEITAATLADVGRKIEAYGATVDRPWLVGLLRGDVLAFGRLQVEREVSADGRALHIPEGGALTPAEIDDSLALARRFLGDGAIVCTSWLFDPALSRLPESSNIAAFVSRFEVGAVEPSPSGSRSAAKFVFRRPLAEVLEPAVVIPTSGVERIVAEHLRSGRHWSEPRATLRA